MTNINLKLLLFTLVFLTTSSNILGCINVDKYMTEYCLKTNNNSQVRKETIVDLDNDKQKDYIATCSSICGASGNCTYKIFISNNRCIKEVGEINGMLKKVIESKSNGSKDITQYSKNGCAGRAGRWSYLKYDKEKYVVTRSIDCKCKNSLDRPKECPPWK